MNFKMFSAIYPNYLDSNKTVKLGRRIATKHALPEPTIQDIHEALVSLNIRHAIQPHKGYSRDASSRWDNSGRVLFDTVGAFESRISNVETDGAFDSGDDIPEMEDSENRQVEENNNGNLKGKKQLLRLLAKIIRNLPSRQKRLEEKVKLLEEEKLKAAKAEKLLATKTGGSSGGSGNRKKKGKKKK